MTGPAREIYGRDRNGETVSAALSVPVQSDGQPEWVCIVHCTAIFETDKEIAGIDAAQALDLAEGFIRTLWEHHGITPE